MEIPRFESGKLMREIETYNNAVFSISLWGAHDKTCSRYVVYLSLESDDETEYKMYELEGELIDAHKTFEEMKQTVKGVAHYRADEDIRVK